MNIIPDFAIQMQDVSRLLEAQAQTTATFWRDKKREEYYDKYITPYLEGIMTYVEGGSGIQGKGIIDLTRFLGEKLADFDKAISGSC